MYSKGACDFMIGLSVCLQQKDIM